jgi:hypothetical protein
MSTNDPLSRFHYAALEWAGGSGGQVVVDAAALALVEGLDTPALCYLAGTTRLYADEEAEEWAPKAAAELGLCLPERRSIEAYVQVTRLYASRFLTNPNDPRSFARTGYQLCVAANYPPELNVFAGLDNWYDMLCCGFMPGEIVEIDKATISAAEVLAALL